MGAPVGNKGAVTGMNPVTSVALCAPAGRFACPLGTGA
jgi:hypothetical protein